jgi:alpha-glucoside transport system substrate-binding protein
MASTTQRRIYALMGVAALALTATACKSGDGTTNDNLSKPECAAFKDYSGIAGKKVTIYASIRDTEEDLLKQSWKDFENCTGVKIEYEGSGEFETQVKVRVDGGRAPDIAFVPQPGVVEYFAKGGKLKELGANAKTTATANYSADWLKYATIDG